MIDVKMRLDEEERAILAGKRGDTLRKAYESVVLFGDLFGASRLVPLSGGVHLVTSFGVPMIGPVYELADELIAAGLSTERPFTADPRPYDFENVPVGFLERLIFTRIMYSKQASYEAQLEKLGLAGKDAFTCACYMDEVGNVPARGDLLAWAESSAVVYANSVIGARSNRNSGVLELLCGIIGKVPLFGLLEDEGRRASWIIEVRTSKRPEAQILGSAVGMKVVEDVPYIVGLDRWFPDGLGGAAKDYLKDLGAAAASNGAVGLYHVEGLTPEAADSGRELVRVDARTYVIDDAELDRVRASYPVMWKRADAAPARCFIGCPHLSRAQLEDWTARLNAALAAAGRSRLAVDTIFTAPPAVAAAFRSSPAYASFAATGARLSSICPLMYMNNPLCAKRPVMTNSNKLRTYSAARYYGDDEALAIVTGGRA